MEGIASGEDHIRARVGSSVRSATTSQNRRPASNTRAFDRDAEEPREHRLRVRVLPTPAERFGDPLVGPQQGAADDVDHVVGPSFGRAHEGLDPRRA